MTTIDKLTKTPAPNTVYETVNKLIDAVEQGGGGGGTATDVQINGTSITSSNVANIVTNSAYNSSTNKIATMSDVFSRNIGEIVQSTIPLTDAGLHLLDGSLIYEGGVYDDFFQYMEGLYNTPLYAWNYSGSTTLDITTVYTLSQTPVVGDIVFANVDGVITNIKNLVNASDRTVGDFEFNDELGYDAIIYYYNSVSAGYIFTRNANLDTTYPPEYFCSESDWQTSVTNYGVCGKFVYTPTLGNTTGSIRLPYLIGFIEGTNTLSETGNLTEAGLPNITGSVVSGCWSNSGISGCFYGKGDVSSASGTDNRRKALFDASRSSAIYGNSDTVQPQSIKVLYYIVVANSTKTEIEVDIDNVATDLNILNVELNRRSASYLTESYVNGTSGYRVYSDKWCVQWGTSTISNGNNGLEVTLTKSYSDTNFCVLVTHREGSYGTTGMCANVTAVNKIKIFYNTTAQRIMQWQTSGYLP